MNNWCTIESDPGVFTEVLETMGVKDVMVEELFALNDQALSELSPAFGLLFLFKWTQETAESSHHTPLIPEQVDPDMFFARQTVTNACATQALLSILLNQSERVNLGEDLVMFKEFTRDFSAEDKGEALGGNDNIRLAHNSFARPFAFEEPQQTGASRRKTRYDDEDDSSSYHFVAYIPYKGGLYELDGLQPGPICLSQGEFGEDIQGPEWLHAVRPHIEQRIQRYSTNEIRFNLMALIRDKRVSLAQQAAQAQAAGDVELASKCREELSRIEDKRQTWYEENLRRKHNYVPFVVAALRLLAKHKKLKGLVKAAQEKEADRKRALQSAD